MCMQLALLSGENRHNLWVIMRFLISHFCCVMFQYRKWMNTFQAIEQPRSRRSGS